VNPAAEVVLDLIARVEESLTKISRRAANLDVDFTVDDVVDDVERRLPHGYPTPTAPGTSRREIIADIVRDALSGALYESN
jgi:hypothetical protein